MKNIFENIESMQSHIEPLHINGLNGRMLRLPSLHAKYKTREILLVYGHHSSIERIYGVAEVLSDYGNVTVPDLPGCGGMDSYYKIGVEPTLDAMADYLATFIKLRYRRKKVSIIGMSLGFVIATRMLQRYPELVKRVDLLISMVGFTRKDDAKVGMSMKRTYWMLGHVFSHKLPSIFFYNVVLHPALIRAVYAKTPNAKNKFKHLTKDEHNRSIEFEIVLWRNNDVRTYMKMLVAMIELDNCTAQIDLPVYHISVEGDQYFDNAVVEQHMRVIFTDFTEIKAVLPNHAPSIVASKKDAEPFIPKDLRKVLS